MNTQTNNELVFNIAKIINDISTAKMRAEVLANEDFVKFKSKKAIKGVAKFCGLALREITDMLNPDAKKLIESELMTPNNFLQIENINNAMIALPEGIRNQIEDYVMAQYNTYSLNQK